MIESSYHPYSHNFEEKLFQETNLKTNGENSTLYEESPFWFLFIFLSPIIVIKVFFPSSFFSS